MPKIKRVVQGKSFRLIDFHIFNKRGDIVSDEDSEGSDTNDVENFIIQMFGINEKG